MSSGAHYSIIRSTCKMMSAFTQQLTSSNYNTHPDTSPPAALSRFTYHALRVRPRWGFAPAHLRVRRVLRAELAVVPISPRRARGVCRRFPLRDAADVLCLSSHARDYDGADSLSDGNCGAAIHVSIVITLGANKRTARRADSKAAANMARVDPLGQVASHQRDACTTTNAWHATASSGPLL